MSAPGYLRAFHGRRISLIRPVIRDAHPSAAYMFEGDKANRRLSGLNLLGDSDPRCTLIGPNIPSIEIPGPLFVPCETYGRKLAIEPADINRLIERDEHACALQELAFWLTVPGPWQVWADREGGTRFGDRNNVSWPLPVNIVWRPVYGVWRMDRSGGSPDANHDEIIRFYEGSVGWSNHEIGVYALSIDRDSVAVCADARDERGLPVAPRLTVLGPKCVTCDNPAQTIEQPSPIMD